MNNFRHWYKISHSFKFVFIHLVCEGIFNQCFRSVSFFFFVVCFNTICLTPGKYFKSRFIKFIPSNQNKRREDLSSLTASLVNHGGVGCCNNSGPIKS